MKITITVRQSDYDSEDQFNTIERALMRALIEAGLGRVDFVHVGTTEIGFVIDDGQWECEMTNEESNWVFDAAFGQVQYPISRDFTFRSLDSILQPR